MPSNSKEEVEKLFEISCCKGVSYELDCPQRRTRLAALLAIIKK
jgi:hypothetical protein